MPPLSFFGGVIGNAVCNALVQVAIVVADRPARLRHLLAAGLARAGRVHPARRRRRSPSLGHRVRARDPELRLGGRLRERVFLPMIFISGRLLLDRRAAAGARGDRHGAAAQARDRRPHSGAIVTGEGLADNLAGARGPRRLVRSAGSSWRCATSAGSSPSSADELRRRLALDRHRHLGERARAPTPRAASAASPRRAARRRARASRAALPRARSRAARARRASARSAGSRGR